ncbi:Putative transcriptional regulator, ArsR family [Mycobacteroides abscessus subsp. abscessus]|nr:Putative transcriptional regulator, ArsR family [Mycobacteroides abscessus subsp. abscessus]
MSSGAVTEIIRSEFAISQPAVSQHLETFRRNWAPRLDALATEIARGKRQRRASTPHRNAKEGAS